MTAPDSLYAALAAFQASLPAVAKKNTATVTSPKGNYQYAYADLEDISAVVLPLLGRQGLCWTTRPTIDDTGHFVLFYRLSHVSGGVMEGVYPLPDSSSSPQVLGSAITYARRYALCAVTGVSPGGDDDGASSSQAQPGGGPVSRPRRAPVPKASPSGTVERDGGTTDGPCPDCHAPAGRMHATKCPSREGAPNAETGPEDEADIGGTEESRGGAPGS